MVVPYHVYQSIKYHEKFLLHVFETPPRYRIMYFKPYKDILNDYIPTLRKAFYMASKKTSKTTKTFTFNGYVNINIPENEMDHAANYLKDFDTFYADSNQVIVDGYNLKIYHNVDDNNFRASLTCMNAEDANYGYVLGAFADDFVTAMQIVIFKHIYVAKENWNDYRPSGKRNFG